MYRHASVCLQRPVSSPHAWWQDDPAEQATVRDQQAGEPRLDLIARVRSEIAAGVYENPEKWEIALDRLCQRLEEN